MFEQDLGEHLYLAYRRPKRQWRTDTGKPVRSFRGTIRFLKWRKKGKGKGFLWDYDDTLTYLIGEGKGHRQHTSGKGCGRRKKPQDIQGNFMRCRNCSSDEDFVKNCLNKGQGRGNSSSGGPPFSG